MLYSFKVHAKPPGNGAGRTSACNANPPGDFDQGGNALVRDLVNLNRERELGLDRRETG